MKHYQLALDLADLYEVAHPEDYALLEFVQKECLPVLNEFAGGLQAKLNELIGRVQKIVKQSGGDELHSLKEMLRTALKNYVSRSHDQQAATELGNAALRKGRQSMLAVTAIVMMANALIAQHPAQAQNIVHSALQKINGNSIASVKHAATQQQPQEEEQNPPTPDVPVEDDDVVSNSANDAGYQELQRHPEQGDQDAERIKQETMKGKKVRESMQTMVCSGCDGKGDEDCSYGKRPCRTCGGSGKMANGQGSTPITPIHSKSQHVESRHNKTRKRAGYGLTGCPTCTQVYCPGCHDLPDTTGGGTPPIAENCSGGAVGGGSIAGTAMPLGGNSPPTPKIKYRTLKKSKVKEGDIVPFRVTTGR